jgi:hypothetical protein
MQTKNAVAMLLCDILKRGEILINLHHLHTTALRDCHTIVQCPHLVALGVRVCRDDNDRASNDPLLSFSNGLS